MIVSWLRSHRQVTHPGKELGILARHVDVVALGFVKGLSRFFWSQHQDANA